VIHRSPFPAQFRRRLSIAFVVVAGISAGALALGAAIWVFSYRTNAFHERARAHVRDDVQLLAAGAPPEVVAGRLADAETPGGPGVIVFTDGELVSSVETLGFGDLPTWMRDAVRRQPGQLVEGGTDLRTGAALVIGTIDEVTGAEVYYFFSRVELDRSNRELQIALAAGWAIIVGIAGIAGTLIARQALRPVRTAADAARSVAEGLLDTRLPVRSEDEFGEWAASFNEMVAALEQKIDALAVARDREQQFAADIAHELRTPVAAVLTAASHLAEHGRTSPDEVAEIAEIVAASARRLDRLTSEMLELHRLRGGQEILHVEDVDLVAAVGHAARAHGWATEVAVEAADPVVVATDRRRLDRIVVNLVSNAVHHGGPPIRVRVSPADGGAWITVTDGGPGIPATDLARIFDRHYKSSRHRGSAAGGSGLGLSIALESAQRLGGTLEVISTDGRGTTFTLWLPERAPAGSDG
jgi:signal transduction histidine kinase